MKKVLITGCSHPILWYSNLVNTVVEIEKIDATGQGILTAEQRIKVAPIPAYRPLAASIDPRDFKETTEIKVNRLPHHITEEISDMILGKQFDAVSDGDSWDFWPVQNIRITIGKNYCSLVNEAPVKKFRIRLFDTIYNKNYKDLAGMEFDVQTDLPEVDHDATITIFHPIQKNPVVIEPGDWMEVNPTKNNKQHNPEVFEKIEKLVKDHSKEMTNEERNKMLSEEIRGLFDKYDKEGGLIGFIAYGKDIEELGPKTANKMLELKTVLEAAGYKNHINYASDPNHLESIFINDKLDTIRPINPGKITEETGEKILEGLKDISKTFYDNFEKISDFRQGLQVNNLYLSILKFNEWRKRAVSCALKELELVKQCFAPDKISRGVVINQIVKDFQSDFHTEYLKYFPAPGRCGKVSYFQKLSEDMKSLFPEDITPAGATPKERAESTFLNALEFAYRTPFNTKMGIDPAGPNMDKTVVSSVSVIDGMLKILDVFDVDRSKDLGSNDIIKAFEENIFKDPKWKHRGEWKPGFYYPGDKVVYEGNLYEMILDLGLRSCFNPLITTIPIAWKKVPFFPKKQENPTDYIYRGGWRSGTEYKKGEIVKYKGVFYIVDLYYHFHENKSPEEAGHMWKPLPDQDFTPDPSKKFIVEFKSNEKWLKEHLLRRQKQLKRAIAKYTSKGLKTPQSLKDQLNEIEAQLIPKDGK